MKRVLIFLAVLAGLLCAFACASADSLTYAHEMTHAVDQSVGIGMCSCWMEGRAEYISRKMNGTSPMMSSKSASLMPPIRTCSGTSSGMWLKSKTSYWPEKAARRNIRRAVLYNLGWDYDS